MSTKTNTKKVKPVSIAYFDVGATISDLAPMVGKLFMRPVVDKRSGARAIHYGTVRGYIEDDGWPVKISPATKSEQKALTDYYTKLYS